MAAISADTSYDDSAYANNPKPYPDLLVNTRYPYNAEGRLKSLTDEWQTPVGKVSSIAHYSTAQRAQHSDAD